MPAAKRRYVGFAGGSGITPVMSLIRTALSDEPESRFTLFYGNRDSQLGHLPRGAGRPQGPLSRPVRALPFPQPRRRATSSCSTACSTARRCDEAIEHLVGDAGEVDAWFICGPGPMMDAAEGGAARPRHRQGAHPHRALHRRPAVGGARRARWRSCRTKAAGADGLASRSTAAPARSSSPQATSSTAPARPGCRRRSPARPACARPAGPR